MCICKYLNQRVRVIGEYNGKPFNVVSKKKTKKNTHIKRLSFITQFKIEFLRLPVVEKCLEKCLLKNRTFSLLSKIVIEKRQSNLWIFQPIYLWPIFFFFFFFVIYYLFTSSLVTCKRISICRWYWYFEHDNITVVGNVLDKESLVICQWFVDSKIPIYF